jgi:hypothetical protein
LKCDFSKGLQHAEIILIEQDLNDTIRGGVARTLRKDGRKIFSKTN